VARPSDRQKAVAHDEIGRLQVEFEAQRDSYRTALAELKGALGAEINLARALSYATSGARITGGYAYDKYREAIGEFIKAHKAANRAWAAYHKVNMHESYRKRVAHHEAGHAVIGRVVGIPVKLATIKPKDISSHGFVMAGKRDDDFKTFSPVDVIYSFAGVIAEEKYSGVKSLGAGGDIDFIRYHLHRLPKAKRKTIRAELKAKTVELVDKHWKAIEDTAAFLIGGGTLAGDQIDEIIANVGTNCWD
jgi:hypothetical protein